jgi:regulator of protease activity HflC (stomatin/prohibitin superfamily)
MNTEWTIGITAGAAAVAALVTRSRWRHEFLVNEGMAGLLFRDGRFVKQLAAGKHIFWGRHVRVEMIDLRRQAMTLPGQEVLTKDSVGLKTSAVLNWQIADAVKATREVQNLAHDLYNVAHQALRQVVAEFTIEELLATRMNLGAKLLERVATEAAGLGVQVHSIDVRDVMLPGDLRKAFNEVLKAKQEGQAALERARGESAALRNLANAARMMADNPALLNLRVLQTLHDAKDVGNNTLIMGVPGGFVPMKQ